VQAALEVVEYCKLYGDLVAVDRLSVKLEAGRVLGLVGPNGAGKTTTMRAIAGIIPPTSGTLIVAGHDLARAPVLAKGALAYVPDDPHLFDALTVWEHLHFMASVYGVGDWKPAAEALLARFELEPKRNALAQELSRGMRQKLALCCAYLREPALLMLDEPMTGLDPHGIRTLKLSIKEQAARGAAVLISSHLLALVEDLVTDLLILHRGRTLFCGSLESARARFGVAGDSLEELFFRITGSGAPAGPPTDAGSLTASPPGDSEALSIPPPPPAPRR
jgi:ABC-2 type transport system ATP-binding protein